MVFHALPTTPMKNAFGDAALTRGYNFSESVAPSLQRLASHCPSPTAGWPFQSSGQAPGITPRQPHSTPCPEYQLCLPAKFQPLCWDAHISRDRKQHISFHSSRFICLDTGSTMTVQPWGKELFIPTPLSHILLFPKAIPDTFTSQSKTPCPAGISSLGNPLSYLVQLNSKVPLIAVFPCELISISTQCETMPSRDLMCHTDIHFNVTVSYDTLCHKKLSPWKNNLSNQQLLKF